MRRDRGLTLIELLVAMTVFLVTTTAILAIFLMARDAQEKGSSQSEAYRTVFMALDRVESTLRGGQLLSPVDWESSITLGPVTVLTFRYPRRVGDVLQVDATGTPIWAGRARIELRPGGSLVRVDETTGVTNLLANLGTGGTVSFLRTERDLLEVTASAERADPFTDTVSRYKFTTVIRLGNQP